MHLVSLSCVWGDDAGEGTNRDGNSNGMEMLTNADVAPRVDLD